MIGIRSKNVLFFIVEFMCIDKGIRKGEQHDQPDSKTVNGKQGQATSIELQQQVVIPILYFYNCMRVLIPYTA